MVRKVLYPAVFVSVMLMAATAFGAWPFIYCMTATPDETEVEGRIFMPDAVTLVPEGCLVQFIVDLGGDGIDDPLSFFDADHNGVTEGAELDAVTLWIRAGADPGTLPGGNDVLLAGSGWDGTSVIGNGGTGAGVVYEYPIDPYVITTGLTPNQLAWRVWNMSEETMETFCTRLDEEVWYTTGRELGSFEAPDSGWWIGAPTGVPADSWVGFSQYIGWEVLMYMETGDPMYRSQNVLDTKLATCVPEPGTMLLIGGSALLLLLRRKK